MRCLEEDRTQMTLIEMINADFCHAEVRSIPLLNTVEKVQVSDTTILKIDLKLVKK